MKQNNVTTNEFWEKMCDREFVRVDINTGKIAGDYFYTETPPEQVDGFIENKMSELYDELVPDCEKTAEIFTVGAGLILFFILAYYI